MNNRLLAIAETARIRAGNALKKRGQAAPRKRSAAPDFSVLSTESALKIIYYMMVTDGLVFYSEEARFDAIGRELDPAFAAHKDAIIRDCRAHLETVVDAGSYYETLQDGVEQALLSSKPTKDSYVTPKLLVWDLLTVAFSEEHYDEDEREILKYIVRRTKIGEDVFQEMEDSVQALMDTEKELARTGAGGANDALTARKAGILEKIQDLISR